MIDPADIPAEPDGPPHLRVVAMPKDANPSGHIFGGWTLSQMDLASGMFAYSLAEGPVVTVAIDAMRFLRPVDVGDVVSCWCSLVETGDHSLKVKIETWARGRAHPGSEKVTEGVFTFVALDEQGRPRDLPPQASAQ
jgi:acyl-CoA thioesterase YciA